jgi:hypothetical protein
MIIQFSFFAILLVLYFIRFNNLKNYLFLFPISFFLLGWRSLPNYYYGYFFLAFVFGLFEVDENIEQNNDNEENDIEPPSGLSEDN